MKKFIIKILKFISIFIGLMIFFNFIVFPNNKNAFTYKYELLQNTDVEVIVTGNSHLGFGVVADNLSFNSINIANKARLLETDIDILLSIDLEKRKNLKAILLPVSYYSLFNKFNTVSKNHIDQKRLYYNYYKLKQYSQNLYKNSLVLNEPFKELFEDSFLLNYMKKSPFSKKGWRANDNVFLRDKEILKKVSNLNVNSLNRENVDYNLRKLEELLIKCKELGVRVFLILPPYSSYYYEISKNEFNNFIKQELNTFRKYNNISILESNNFMPTSLEFYENSDHLNKKGALVYTKKLDSILKIRL